MEELMFIDKIKRIIKMRHDDVVAALVSGGVDNMEKYQYMLGQIRTYQYMSQEISSLLEKKEQKDDGTVISIKQPSKGSPKV
jgi:DNA-binding ferritin-like protein